MTHEISQVRRMTLHDGRRRFELTFQRGREEAQVYCKESQDGLWDIRVEELIATSRMDEIVMERMAENFLDQAADLFSE